MQILEVKPDRKRPLGRSRLELENFIEGACQIVHEVQRKPFVWPWEFWRSKQVLGAFHNYKLLQYYYCML